MNPKKRINKILITAGPTIERIDPVRYISNFSSGIMGYEVAREARKAGHKVSLISGPVGLDPVKGIKLFRVKTAREMLEKVLKEIKKNDCIVMAAAVSDFRPAREAKKKIKKRDGMFLELVKNPDILKEIRKYKKIKKVGFALETENFLKNAKEKLDKKGVDIIVANRKSNKNDPFGEGKKDFVFLNKNGEKKTLKNVTKRKCAKMIIKEIERFL